MAGSGKTWRPLGRVSIAVDFSECTKWAPLTQAKEPLVSVVNGLGVEEEVLLVLASSSLNDERFTRGVTIVIFILWDLGGIYPQ